MKSGCENEWISNIACQEQLQLRYDNKQAVFVKQQGKGRQKQHIGCGIIFCAYVTSVQ